MTLHLCSCKLLAMIKFGAPPYLECSSRGDKRFSAFYAHLAGRSIESLYQAAKVFEDGSTRMSWRQAKGRKPVGFRFRGEVHGVHLLPEFYYYLWWVYMHRHPEIHDVIREAPGLSDMFGQPGHCCQAEALWWFRQGRSPYEMFR